MGTRLQVLAARKSEGNLLVIEQLRSEFGHAVEARGPQNSEILDGVTPQAIAVPRDEETAQALVTWCGRRRVAFVVAGGLSRWHIGAVPARFEVLISTAKLTKIWDFDEGNATVEAGSGITLRDLDALVGEKKQFVPISGRNEFSTLGGAVATNQSGAQGAKYGLPRDLVTGVHVALSDGRSVRAGGKVVKNVAGYDLPKIFIGSFGTLGLFTRVTLRLRPQSPHVFDYASTCDVAQIAGRAQQILSGAFDATLVRARFCDGKWQLQARFEGAKKSVQGQIAQLPRADSSASTCGESDVAKVELRARLPLNAAWRWARECETVGANFLEWDAAQGFVRAQFAALSLEEIVRLRNSAQAARGWMLLERAPSEWKTPELVWGEKRGDWALMRALKEKYDAAQVCAPGRFVGGL